MCRVFKCVLFWLVFIGALNWGLVGFFSFDLVAFLLGDMTFWARMVYGIIGISALVYALLIYLCNKNGEDY